jgi:hypothetical protein
MADSATPLSDLITRYLAEQSESSWKRFINSFLRSEVGVIVRPIGNAGVLAVAAGTKIVAGNQQLTYGISRLNDGREMILACADFLVFRQKFAGAFNATVLGSELLNGVVASLDCQGIQINSAASFHSVAIDRQTVEALLSSDLSRNL